MNREPVIAGGEPGVPRFGLRLAAITALALALRLLAAARPLAVLDRWFIPDDTYYVLAIARSLAEGLGPTANGEILTSGFQPLLAFLLVPVFAWTSGLEAPIRAALVLLGACDAANAALLGWLVCRWRGPAAGLVAACLWAISPIALDNALGGLETALALTALLVLTALWLRHRERPSWRSATLVGAAAGLALLARVDTVFFVALLGLVELYGRHRRYLSAIVAAAVAVVAPWWGYCIVRFGTLAPDSGAAAREVAYAYQGDYLSPLSETLWATWTLIGPPFIELTTLRVSLYSLAGFQPASAWIAGLAGLLLLAALYWWPVARVLRDLGAGERAPFAAFAAHGILIAAFYAYYVPVLWFFRRYTAPTAAVATVLVAVAVTWAWRARVGWIGQMTLALFGAGAVLALVGTGERLLADPDIAARSAVDGPTGYFAPARELLAEVPPGSVVAGLQSGASSYLAPSEVTVHNLDGVVDRNAAKAFRAGELGALLRERGVTHFLDWQLQRDMLAERMGAEPVALQLAAEATVGQQSGHRLRLWRVVR